MLAATYWAHRTLADGLPVSAAVGAVGFAHHVITLGLLHVRRSKVAVDWDKLGFGLQDVAQASSAINQGGTLLLGSKQLVTPI